VRGALAAAAHPSCTVALPMTSARSSFLLPFVAAIVSLASRTARAEDGATPGIARAADPGSSVDAVASPSLLVTAPVVAVSHWELAFGARHRPMPGVIGSEIDARIALARHEGPFVLAADGMIRRAIGTRDDVDAIASARLLVAIARGARIGGEARMRGEIAEGIVASDDVGRPIEVTSGGVVDAAVGPLMLRAVAGGNCRAARCHRVLRCSQGRRSRFENRFRHAVWRRCNDAFPCSCTLQSGVCPLE
jgi:hypothetical protein